MPQLNTHTRASFSNQILTAFLVKTFLTRLTRTLVLAPLGKQQSLAKKQGRTLRFFRFDSPAANTTALGDGVSPDGISLTDANVDVTLSQYGDFVAISDQLQDTGIADYLKESADLLGYRAALSIDTIVRNDLDANGTQRYADAANNSSRANVETGADELSSVELRVVMEQLRANDAPTFDDGNYRGVIHPFMEAALLAETAASAFMVLAAHAGTNVAERGEIGTAYGIKLLRSSNIRADATSTNTYGNIFLGKDAFASASLEKSPGSVEMIMHAFGEAGSEDPLNQRATVGYKFWYGEAILQTARTQIVWAYGT